MKSGIVVVINFLKIICIFVFCLSAKSGKILFVSLKTFFFLFCPFLFSVFITFFFFFLFNNYCCCWYFCSICCARWVLLRILQYLLYSEWCSFVLYCRLHWIVFVLFRVFCFKAKIKTEHFSTHLKLKCRCCWHF